MSQYFSNFQPQCLNLLEMSANPRSCFPNCHSYRSCECLMERVSVLLMFYVVFLKTILNYFSKAAKVTKLRLVKT